MLYDGDTFEHDGNTFKVTFPRDDYHGAPWDEEGGHGPVSEAPRGRNYHGYTSKAPGEMLLGDGWIYDFAEACRIARRDGWGPAFYQQIVETSANGLRRINAHWYIGRELHAFTSYWSDDLNPCYADARDAMRASYPSARAYAAAAAMADFDRLRRWCAGHWCYVGVVVELCDDEGETVGGYSASLWGIESDAGDYLEEVARELADEVIAGFRAIAS